MSKKKKKKNKGKGKGTREPSLGEKAQYVAFGVAVGVAIAPYVRERLTQLRPLLDGLLEQVVGDSEGLAERASDIRAAARGAMSKAS